MSPRRPATASPPRPRRKRAAGEEPPPPPTETLELAGGKRPHPALGLGLWALGRWRAEDEARTKATLQHAYERGLRWFDTAEVYGAGRSERLLGEFLHRAPGTGAEAFVATKVSWEHLRGTQVKAAIVNSLERLGRRSVDLYLVHAPDPRVPLQETMAALEALWKEGRVGAIGASNFSVEQLEEAGRYLTEARLSVHQMRWNLLERDDAEPVARYCREHGILVEAYTPLARGLLVGRYLDGAKVPSEVRRFAQDLFGESRLEEVLGRARRLREFAQEVGVPMVSLALRWLYSRGAAPVFGASRPEQVDQILHGWSVRPSEDVLARAEAIGRGDRA